MHFGDNYAHFGKWTLFEASLKVPLIVKPPKSVLPAKRRGTSVDHVVELVDVYPTVLELAGLANKPFLQLDGESLVPLMKGNTAQRVKDYAISIQPVCENMLARRSLPCTTKARGGDVIRGVGVSVRTASERQTEWRKTATTPVKCAKAGTEAKCRAKPGCAWKQYVVFTNDAKNKHFLCITDLATYEGVQFRSDRGLVAREVYDNTETANLARERDGIGRKSVHDYIRIAYGLNDT